MTLRVHPDEIVASSSSPLLGVAPWWERARLGDLVEVTNGAAFKSDLFNNDGVGEPLVRIRDVGRDFTQVHYAGPFEERHVIGPGDILVGMDGDFRVAPWLGPRAVLNQRVCRLRVLDPSTYDERFLLLVLQPYLDAVHAVTSAVTVKHLSSRTIEDLPIPLPPRAEQEKIVAALDERLSGIDNAIQALTRARVRLSQLRSQLVGAVLGLSGAPNLNDDDPSVPLPMGWRWVRASDACEMVSSGSTPKAADLYPDSGEIPFIKVYNLGFDGRLDFAIKPTFVTRKTHESLLRRSRLRPGDVLINIVGPPLGKLSVVPDDYPEWNMNQAVAAFRPRPILRSEFLAYLLMDRIVVDPLLRTGKATAGQINLNISACRRLWLPVPPAEVQAQLVNRLDAAMSSWTSALDQVNASSSRGHALRRSVLAAGLSGQLVPREQDDGSAYVPLERRRRVGLVKRNRRVKAS
ncbi:restriction endonuclease subunit S [Rhabdothermincola salaria]|uniref:restriction endonuclease subunit S n=1 Tax=Rhabdothermincola salaria TaxID=2903142 RepID=UPI001E5C1F24|nr:restriction endonuclease subunit S [Rhabdothermincola salaria]MCD9625628.1 restriction endonuclease subunit S [Rhabdothermincola salaria]